MGRQQSDNQKPLAQDLWMEDEPAEALSETDQKEANALHGSSGSRKGSKKSMWREKYFDLLILRQEPSLSLRSFRLTHLPSQLLPNPAAPSGFASVVPFLTALDVSHNNIAEVSPLMASLTNLESINLAYNRIERLPNEFFQLTKLRVLNIAHNQLTSIDPAILQLQHLEEGCFSNNSVRTLPQELFQLPLLRGLSLHHNILDHHSFPPPFEHQVHSLSVLDMSFNKLGEVPVQICTFTTLQELYLSNNKLTYIREENFPLSQLADLRILDLSHNSISRLGPVASANLCSLSSLAVLSLASNKLTKLPHDIWKLENLHLLDIEGNPEIQSKLPPRWTTTTLLKWLRDVHQSRRRSNTRNQSRRKEKDSQDIQSFLLRSNPDMQQVMAEIRKQRNRAKGKKQSSKSSDKGMEKKDNQPEGAPRGSEKRPSDDNSITYEGQKRTSHSSQELWEHAASLFDIPDRGVSWDNVAYQFSDVCSSSHLILRCSEWEIEQSDDSKSAKAEEGPPPVPGLPLMQPSTGGLFSFAAGRRGSIQLERDLFSTPAESSPLEEAIATSASSRPSSDYGVREKTVIFDNMYNVNPEQGKTELRKRYNLEREMDNLPYYADHFIDREHVNYFGWDPTLGPVVVSITKEKDDSALSHWYLLRTQLGTKLATLSFPVPAKPRVHHLLASLKKTLHPHLAQTELFHITGDAVNEALAQLEDEQILNSYKFGVMYCKEGQTLEEEMLANDDPSEDLKEFLDFLGPKVPLKGCQRYAGGLDVKHDRTGTHSIAKHWRNLDFMFHVATMLPYDPKDKQQIQRKRHIGNDVVVVVFVDGSTPFSPNSISSRFNSIFIIVRKIKGQDPAQTYYQVGITARHGVPLFGPPLGTGIFAKDRNFREWLYAKMVNGERAAYQRPALAEGIIRTRLMLLTEIVQKTLPEKHFEKVGTSKVLRRSSSFHSTAKNKFAPIPQPKKNALAPEGGVVPKLNLAGLASEKKKSGTFDFLNLIRKSPKTPDSAATNRISKSPRSAHHPEVVENSSSTPKGSSPKGSTPSVNISHSPPSAERTPNANGKKSPKATTPRNAEEWEGDHIEKPERKKRSRTLSDKKKNAKKDSVDNPKKKGTRSKTLKDKRDSLERSKEKPMLDKGKNEITRGRPPTLEIEGPLQHSMSQYSAEFFSMMSEGARALQAAQSPKRDDARSNSGSVDLWESMGHGYMLLTKSQQK